MILAFAIILTLMLLAVVYFDVTKFIIPNKLNLAFIALYPVFVLLAPVEVQWPMAIVVMLCFFVGGILLFMTNIMGGGDIKLMIALSLWIGWNPNELAGFGMWVALSGGVLAIFLIIVRLIMRVKNRSAEKQQALPKVLRMHEPIPYGLAIAYAFGFMLWSGRIEGLAL